MRLSTAALLLPAVLRATLAYTALSDPALTALPFPGDDFDIDHGALLAPILVPRVPGTPGSAAVLQHLADFFRTHLPEWTLTFQNSSSPTPTSNGEQVPFRNLIATRDPPWLDGQEGDVGRLALVAHYDSKLTPEGFIGATDSAVPCAVILHAARTIDRALTAKWTAMQDEGVGPGGGDGVDVHKGIQILLLDGEEAFDTWTHDDSVYGARSLAAEWEGTINPALSTFRTPLASLELFVLLDLLGGKDPTVPSYFKTTHWAYKKMADVESRLRKLDKLKSSPSKLFLHELGKKDTDRWSGGFVEDDHLPFMARGVEILHIIPSPFPRVWHTMNDDGPHLDLDTCEDWAVITAAFAAEWMDLEGHFGEVRKVVEVEGRDELDLPR